MSSFSRVVFQVGTLLQKSRDRKDNSYVCHSDLCYGRGVVRTYVRPSFVGLPVLYVGSPAFWFNEVSMFPISASSEQLIHGYRRSETLRTLFMFTINRAILMSMLQAGMLSSYLSARIYLYW